MNATSHLYSTDDVRYAALVRMWNMIGLNQTEYEDMKRLEKSVKWVTQ